MNSIESFLTGAFVNAFEKCFEVKPDVSGIQIQKTKKEFEGDFTVNVFPFLRISKSKPEETADKIGAELKNTIKEIEDYNVIKGFLNLSFTNEFWINSLKTIAQKDHFGYSEPKDETVLVEFSSPNTNKPLHLGHMRNIFLGDSVSRILKAAGKNVVRTQIVNDRGIHICKSMVAYLEYNPDATPENTGKKGDHLVGDFYVKFDKEYKKQIAELKEKGVPEEEAKEKAPLMIKARETLKKWEANDSDTVALWEKMNNWVYAGFDITYKALNIEFDKLYFESQTYLKGREIVKEGLGSNLFYQKENNSIWIDLTGEGLDEKLLLRADGTAVYMTQDIGTAILRSNDYPDMKSMVYTVGNEQDYHFHVLFKILEKLGYSWAKNCFHLSYGMVELPEGKMKSREGNVVDADDLIKEMKSNAEAQGIDRGSYDDLTEQERQDLASKVSLAALKYFILKVDPKKNMTFDPKESIDLNGDTGPFIQYTYARTASILNKAGEVSINFTTVEPEENEREVIKHLNRFPEVIAEAAAKYNPATVARYCFETAKAYNTFYQNTPIFHADNENTIKQRVLLSSQVGKVLKSGMGLLGIEVPERF